MCEKSGMPILIGDGACSACSGSIKPIMIAAHGPLWLARGLPWRLHLRFWMCAAQTGSVFPHSEVRLPLFLWGSSFASVLQAASSIFTPEFERLHQALDSSLVGNSSVKGGHAHAEAIEISLKKTGNSKVQCSTL